MEIEERLSIIEKKLRELESRLDWLHEYVEFAIMEFESRRNFE